MRRKILKIIFITIIVILAVSFATWHGWLFHLKLLNEEPDTPQETEAAKTADEFCSRLGVNLRGKRTISLVPPSDYVPSEDSIHNVPYEYKSSYIRPPCYKLSYTIAHLSYHWMIVDLMHKEVVIYCRSYHPIFIISSIIRAPIEDVLEKRWFAKKGSLKKEGKISRAEYFLNLIGRPEVQTEPFVAQIEHHEYFVLWKRILNDYRYLADEIRMTIGRDGTLYAYRKSWFSAECLTEIKIPKERAIAIAQTRLNETLEELIDAGKLTKISSRELRSAELFIVPLKKELYLAERQTSMQKGYIPPPTRLAWVIKILFIEEGEVSGKWEMFMIWIDAADGKILFRTSYD